MVVFTGCSNKKNEKIDTLKQKISHLETENSDKAEEIGRLKKEIENLSTKNSILRKDIAKKEITFDGKKFISIQILIFLFIICNAIWFIVYKKKDKRRNN